MTGLADGRGGKAHDIAAVLLRLQACTAFIDAAETQHTDRPHARGAGLTSHERAKRSHLDEIQVSAAPRVEHAKRADGRQANDGAVVAAEPQHEDRPGLDRALERVRGRRGIGALEPENDTGQRDRNERIHGAESDIETWRRRCGQVARFAAGDRRYLSDDLAAAIPPPIWCRINRPISPVHAHGFAPMSVSLEPRAGVVSSDVS